MNIEQIQAEYVEHMGSDLSVVNAARASFGKTSEWEVNSPVPRERALKLSDANLIRFLATGYRSGEWDAFLNEVADCSKYGSREELSDLLKGYKRKAQHWAPFGHPHISIRISLPIFLARQFVKHQIGATWSEESRRYISDEPGVWFPDEWHTRPDDIKQGSGDVIGPQVWHDELFDRAERSVVHSLDVYDDLTKAGVAPEEARIVLPLNMMTTVYWTGSLLFWSRVYNQRVDSHAQLAAQELAKKIGAIIAPLYPVSWKELTQ